MYRWHIPDAIRSETDLRVTILFFVPRFAPNDPVEAMLAKVAGQSGVMEASQIDLLSKSLSDTFGLSGTLLL